MNTPEVTKEIERITNQLVQKYRPLKIILFGSATREDGKEVNDLDFLIVKQDVPDRGLARMRELEDLIDREMAADMLVYRLDELEERIRLGDPFIRKILDEGRILYG